MTFRANLSAWKTGKWLVYALVLLVPGSVVLFPVLWLVRLDGARTLFRPKSGLTMKTSSEAKPSSFVQRLRRWLRNRGAAERYLAEATDLADLERRQRLLERASGGPAFVTFNH